jgi:hypothetical protein
VRGPGGGHERFAVGVGHGLLAGGDDFGLAFILEIDFGRFGCGYVGAEVVFLVLFDADRALIGV